MSTGTPPSITLSADVVAAIRAGHVIEAIKLVREQHGVRLKEAKDLVDRYRASIGDAPAPSSPPAPPALAADVVAAIRAGHVIQAIKLVREQHGLGLAEAKALVDGYLASHVETAPPPPAPPAPSAEVAAAIRAGQVVMAVKLVRDQHGLGLAEAKAVVDGYRASLAAAAPAPAATPPRIELPLSAVVALRQGDKAAAIEAVRSHARCGLKEAHDAVDAHIAAHPDLREAIRRHAAEARLPYISVAAIVIALAGLAWVLWRTTL